MRRVWLVLLPLLLLPLCAHAKPPVHQWFTVLLDGRKIGAFESSRELRGSDVVTAQVLNLILDRAGTQIALNNVETSTETRAGKPLAFQSQSRLSNSTTTIDGVLHGTNVDVTTRIGGQTQHRQMPWPTGALLPEGMRLAALKAGLKPGTQYSVLSFQPSSLDTATVTSSVGAAADVDLPGGRRTLSQVTQIIHFPDAPMTTLAWVDSEQTVYKLTMPIMGVELTLLACDHACATAPNQPSDIFARTLLRSPHPLTRPELAGALRYTLAPRDRETALTLPQTDEQRVALDGRGIVVTVDRNSDWNAEKPPTREDYRPNDWLQSDAPEVTALAKRAIGEARTPLAKMRRIEQFVRGFIRTKNLDVGYASALEVARNPAGDCTEHAVLVAALGRAAGIATRVVDGLAYAPGFAGEGQVFVPHAWAQAWVDDRWQSFDAALPGFDAGHIALSIGDGDPWRFYSGLDLLGRMNLVKVAPVVEAGR